MAPVGQRRCFAVVAHEIERAGQPASRLCWVSGCWMGGCMGTREPGRFMQERVLSRCLSSPNTKGALQLLVWLSNPGPWPPSARRPPLPAPARTSQECTPARSAHQPGVYQALRTAGSFCSIDSVDPLIPRARQLCRPHFHPNRFVVCPVSHLKSRTTHTICDGLERVHVSLRRIPPLSLCRGYGDGETNGYCDSAEQPAPPDPTHRFPSNPKSADERRRGRKRKQL